jgi:biopolymer transport protein ExbB
VSLHDAAHMLVELVDEGGFIMAPLVALTLVLWYGLGYRMMAVRRGSWRSPAALLDAWRRGDRRRAYGAVDEAARIAVEVERERPPMLRGPLEERLAPLEDRLSRFAILVRGVVVVAPLMGLLGTVSGMIETFESLGDMSLFSQSGGIAGGISEALLTTQMGLAVAIPGLVVGRLLARRQRLLEVEIERIKDLVCARGDMEATR